MHATAPYPVQNLFFSPDWESRAAQLGLAQETFVFDSLQGLRLARLKAGDLADLERWPDANQPMTQQWMAAAAAAGADCLVLKKLAPEGRPGSLPPGSYVIPYSPAPWLDLTQEIQVKKEVLSHLGRTERKITREVGALELRRHQTPQERESWYQLWEGFQRPTDRFSEKQFQLFRTWTTQGELPSWMRLMSLHAGSKPVAAGLFYVWNGVFYYYSPAMTSEPEMRKYGSGKLLVHHLIADAKKEGCTIFDFLQGAHEYKYQWNPQIRELLQVYIPLSLKGRVGLTLFRLARAIRSLLKGARG